MAKIMKMNYQADYNRCMQWPDAGCGQEKAVARTCDQKQRKEMWPAAVARSELWPRAGVEQQTASSRRGAAGAGQQAVARRRLWPGCVVRSDAKSCGRQLWPGAGCGQ